MPRRAAIIPQADISRAIRALKAAGDRVARVVVRPDRGVAIETAGGEVVELTAPAAEPVAPRDPLVF